MHAAGAEPERIRLMFEAIDAGRFDELGAHFTDDVVYERPGYAPIEGLASLDHFYRHVRVIASGRHELWRIVVTADAAACWGRFRGRSRDGHELDERFADVYVLRSGKVARRATHFFRAAI